MTPQNKLLIFVNLRLENWLASDIRLGCTLSLRPTRATEWDPVITHPASLPNKNKIKTKQTLNQIQKKLVGGSIMRDKYMDIIVSILELYMVSCIWFYYFKFLNDGLATGLYYAIITCDRGNNFA